MKEIPQIECEALTYAGQDDEIAELWQIAHDIIETRGPACREHVERWLPGYTHWAELRESLHPLIVNATIDHALRLSETK